MTSMLAMDGWEDGSSVVRESKLGGRRLSCAMVHKQRRDAQFGVVPIQESGRADDNLGGHTAKYAIIVLRSCRSFAYLGKPAQMNIRAPTFRRRPRRPRSRSCPLA
jgi:hypothetical protein